MTDTMLARIAAMAQRLSEPTTTPHPTTKEDRMARNVDAVSGAEFGIRIERPGMGRDEIGFDSRDDALAALADWRADLPESRVTLIIRTVTRQPWAIAREVTK